MINQYKTSKKVDWNQMSQVLGIINSKFNW